jgi:hypothetical protein
MDNLQMRRRGKGLGAIWWRWMLAGQLGREGRQQGSWGRWMQTNSVQGSSKAEGRGGEGRLGATKEVALPEAWNKVGEMQMWSSTFLPRGPNHRRHMDWGVAHDQIRLSQQRYFYWRESPDGIPNTATPGGGWTVSEEAAGFWVQLEWVGNFFTVGVCKSWFGSPLLGFVIGDSLSTVKNHVITDTSTIFVKVLNDKEDYYRTHRERNTSSSNDG